MTLPKRLFVTGAVLAATPILGLFAALPFGLKEDDLGFGLIAMGAFIAFWCAAALSWFVGGLIGAVATARGSPVAR